LGSYSGLSVHHRVTSPATVTISMESCLRCGVRWTGRLEIMGVAASWISCDAGHGGGEVDSRLKALSVLRQLAMGLGRHRWELWSLVGSFGVLPELCDPAALVRRRQLREGLVLVGPALCPAGSVTVAWVRFRSLRPFRLRRPPAAPRNWVRVEPVRPVDVQYSTVQYRYCTCLDTSWG
jgi:hypothetical protein